MPRPQRRPAPPARSRRLVTAEVAAEMLGVGAESTRRLPLGLPHPLVLLVGSPLVAPRALSQGVFPGDVPLGMPVFSWG